MTRTSPQRRKNTARAGSRQIASRTRPRAVPCTLPRWERNWTARVADRAPTGDLLVGGVTVPANGSVAAIFGHDQPPLFPRR
jgi:hypothetical protein